MSTWLWVVLAVVVIVIAVGVVSSAIRRRRSHILQSGFGPEYDRTVERTGDQSAAEADLRDRQRRRDELELRPLAPVARKGYMDAWQETQAEFVDDPAHAVDDADRLIQSVMRDRGYPVEDFDDRASLVSVDHPIVVERYRRAHAHRARERGRRRDDREPAARDAGLPGALRRARRGQRTGLRAALKPAPPSAPLGSPERAAVVFTPA